MFQRKKKNNILNMQNENISSKNTVRVEKEATNIIQFFYENNVKGIQGTYSHDLDLKQIYMLVLDCIQYNVVEFLPGMKKGWEEGTKELMKNGAGYSLIEKNEKIKDVEKMSNYVKFLTNAITDFERETKLIIEEHAKIALKDEKMDFNSNDFRQKHVYIDEFINITKKYIPINLLREIEIKSVCLCSKPPKTFLNVGEGCKVCPICKAEINIYDTNRTAAIPKTSYDDWSNFEKAIQTFQGIQSKALPDDLEEKLDYYFEEQGLPIGKDVRKKPQIEKGRKEGTSRSIMQQALISIGYIHLVGDLLLIMSNYWGWALPMIDRHIDEIQRRFELSKPYYHLYKGDRKSSLGAQFRLFQILYSMHFDVDASDFKLVMTPDLQREYNKIWSKVAESLEWDWKPL